MNTTQVDKIVNAVLYEGYMLYPYRRCIKNQRRWMFGCVYPQSFSEAHGGAEPWTMLTQCLVEGNRQTEISVAVRFLHLTQRNVARIDGPETADDDANLHFVDAVEIDGNIYESWQEAVERNIDAGCRTLGELLDRPARVPFVFHADRAVEWLSNSQGTTVAALVRKQRPLEGVIELSAAPWDGGLFSVTVRICNTSAIVAASSASSASSSSSDEAQKQSFVSTHTILGAQDGQFISSIDPPEHCREIIGQLHNEGAWPVLVGDAGRRDMMLSSPIILYDYPQVAAESPGNLFDSTEIDEMLALRVMTLTEEEKQRMRNVDDRSREILRRTELLPEEQWMKLHGAIRGLRRLEPTGK